MSKHSLDQLYTPETVALVSAVEDAHRQAKARRFLDFGSASAAASSSAGDDPRMSEPVAQARAYGQPFYWETGRKSYRRSRYPRSYRPAQRRRFKSRPVKKPVSVLLSQSRALIKKLRRKR